MSDKTRAVQEYPVINGKLTPRWFPMVPGFPGEFVVPRAWVNKHCPDGFALPEQAHQAARDFLFN